MVGPTVAVPGVRAHAAASRYATECAAIAGTGAATDERSFYPPLNRLLEELGALHTPQITPVSDPAARAGDFPDVVCWDGLSQVCALPAEVKPTSFTVEQLLGLDQARRYARSFGGGFVLLTNLRDFVWAELNTTGDIVERDRVTLFADEAAFERGQTPDPVAAARLLAMLEAAWTLRPSLAEAQHVAQLLGYHAQRMSEALRAAPNPDRLLVPLKTSLRDGLGMELEERFLVGTVVQTLVYGLFAAWLESEQPRSFKWQEAPHSLGLGIIASLLHEASNPSVVRGAALERHLAAVARVLNWVDRAAFEAQFGGVGGEAIEYFYEPFLAAFDPELRSKLGVWYTPRDIAEYQVRRVDHHLREDFGLADGLADDQAIVLDPACGTGTYLAAVLRHIFTHHLERGEPPETAARRTLQAAQTRIVGFEILPAAYVVCHLHLHRTLTTEMGAAPNEDRLPIYLCNALTGWGSGNSPPPLPLPGLEAELQASLDVKGTEPVLVVIGNPPYEGYSAADNPEEAALARPWIEPLWPQWGVRKHRLGDLYVRFWRIGLRKISEFTGRGVVCFITNRKWLGGRSFPAMRGDIAARFDKVVVDDLHGDVRAQQAGDGSVFTTATATGIRVGVAITTAVRTGPQQTGSIAAVRVRDLGGSGAAKRQQLRELANEDIDRGLRPRSISAAGRWRLVGEDANDAPALDEYFQNRYSGVQPVRDEAVTDHDRAALERRMRDYFDYTLSWEDLTERHPAFAVTRARYDGRKVRERHQRARTTFKASRMVRFLYRPGDVRWLYWEPMYKLLNEARRELIPQHAIKGQHYIAVPETPRKAGAARPVMSSAVVCFAACDPDARIFPRLSIAQGDEQMGLEPEPEPDRGPQTNVASQWLDAARAVGIEGDDADVGDRIFYALVAVMFSPTWANSVPPDQDTFASIPLPRRSKAAPPCRHSGAYARSPGRPRHHRARCHERHAAPRASRCRDCAHCWGIQGH